MGASAVAMATTRYTLILSLLLCWLASAQEDELSIRARRWAFLHGDTNAANVALASDSRMEWWSNDGMVSFPKRWDWACSAPATDADLPDTDSALAWWADLGESRKPAMRDLKRDIAATIDGLQTNVTVSAFPAGSQRQEVRDLADYVTDLAREVQRLRRIVAENERGK